jgi:uncharacterized protein YecE (DUF72 family)
LPRAVSPALPLSPAVPADAPAGLYIGTSGWSYPTWKPDFYPATVSSKKFLSFYASQLNSVEVNFTFRTLPSAEQLQGWLDAVPAGFRFSFKAPQRLTHFQRLLNSEDALAEFLDAILPARKQHKLGAVLFQLPPNFKADPARLKSFLSLRRLRSASAPPLAFEFRHESWFSEETFTILRKANAALCVAETEDFITPDIQTAPHRCYRLRVSGGYSPRQLSQFAERFTSLAAQGDVYVYLKHEDAPTGALNATALLRRTWQLASARPTA